MAFGLVCCLVVSVVFGLFLTGCQQAPEKPADGTDKTHATADATHGDAEGDNAAPEGEGEDAEGEGEAPKPKVPWKPLTVQIPLGNGDALFAVVDDPYQQQLRQKGLMLPPVVLPDPEAPAHPPATEDAESDGNGEGEEAATIPKPTQKYPLVILLHELNGRGADWGKFPEALVKAGYAVAVVDLRGHGKSGTKRNWRTFEGKDWQATPKDIYTVMKFLTNNVAQVPQVQGENTALVGASIGANMMIIAAGNTAQSHTKVMRSLVALSPSLKEKNLETTVPIVHVTQPILMMASQTDEISYHGTELLYRLAQGKKSLLLFKNVGRGTEMLRDYPELQGNVVQWLLATLPPKPLPVVYPKPKPTAEDEDAEE